MYDQVEQPWPWPSAGADFVVPMYHRCHADPDGFLDTLADLAEERGGWTAYGAERLMVDVAVVGGNVKIPFYDRIMTTSLSFLRASGVPPKMVTGYEWRHWLDSGGTTENWIPRRPTPTATAARISGLGVGETRRLAQLSARAKSSVLLVKHDEPDRFCWLTDAPQSDDDPTRVQWVQLTGGSLHEIYVRIGLYLQIPPYWHDRELEPYFPLPEPTF
jgi:hypothetical protein